MCHLRSFDTADGENTGLLNFTQESGLFAHSCGYSHTKYHFVNFVSQLRRCSIQVQLNVRFPLFLENLRGIWRFKGDIFSEYALNLELHFVGVVF